MPSITLLGLGPGDASLLTRQAWQVLETIPEITLRTRQHPVVDELPHGLHVHSFDDMYVNGESLDRLIDQIIERVLELGRRPEGVVYGIPGHPFVADSTAHEIARRAQNEGIPVTVVAGLSFLEPTVAALGVDPLPHMALMDAFGLASAHVPSFPADSPAIIAHIHSRSIASEVKRTLLEMYPPGHLVSLVHAAGTSREQVEKVALSEIDQSDQIGRLTSLYIPPLGPGTSFEAFQEVIAHLRAPNGCPWDREQTHQSLRPYLLEEAYEVLSALDAQDPWAMREELGDLLLQIVLHAQIANENGEFNIAQVLHDIHTKIVRRHPHVFGDLVVKDVGSVLQTWERLKAAERVEKGQETKGLLDGIPLALPALSQAQEYQKRAARVGFDWPDVHGVVDKVMEELDEVRSSPPEKRAAEIGDLLFAVVNLGRWYTADAESALREANLRFRRRFGHIEKTAIERGQSISELNAQEMDDLWEAAKDLE